MGFKYMEKATIIGGLASPFLFGLALWHPVFGVLAIIAITPVALAVAGAVFFHILDSVLIGIYQVRKWWENTRLW